MHLHASCYAGQEGASETTNAVSSGVEIDSLSKGGGGAINEAEDRAFRHGLFEESSFPEAPAKASHYKLNLGQAVSSGGTLKNLSMPIDPAFEFVNCSYTVMVKKKGEKAKVPRVLINDLSASIPSGMVLAVMGPSGAGKTTLLSMLMLDRAGGKPEGVVKLGGHDFTLDLYTKHCAVVTQHDCLWWALTVLEHLHHALNFYQPSLTCDARTKHLDKLLDAMGLTAAQHTRAGNAYIKGLSGGQKRRLSLGIALCKQPLIIFLDEPTSGLDAAAAAGIMTSLKKVAEDQRIGACRCRRPTHSGCPAPSPPHPESRPRRSDLLHDTLALGGGLRRL